MIDGVSVAVTTNPVTLIPLAAVCIALGGVGTIRGVLNRFVNNEIKNWRKNTC